MTTDASRRDPTNRPRKWSYLYEVRDKIGQFAVFYDSRTRYPTGWWCRQERV
ncbi:hypothetical protein RvVAR031_00070 [Agrobacterium vitis]|nr:hypothetical protein RvVAR031_00070 [Agrobacterium vitis]